MIRAPGRALVCAAGLAVAQSCGADPAGPSPPTPVATVTVTPAADTVVVRRTVQLSAVLRDSRGSVLSGRAVTWTSSDPARATVSSSGLVSTLARGVVSITATAEGRAGSALLTLAPMVTITPAYPSLFVADTLRLAALLADGDGNSLGGGIDAWATTDANVVTVSGDRTVGAIGVGQAMVFARAGGGVDSVEVIVLAPRAGTVREIAYFRDTTRFDGLIITSLYLMQADGSGDVRVSPFTPDGRLV